MSSERAIELHSMIIDGVDTWDDWNIVSVKKPVFSEPELKSTYIDIPGANGQLDLTEVLTGYPTFNNRTGTIQFFLYDDSMKALEKLNIIRNYLHGRKHKIVLNDEPDYYYEGRLVMRDSHPTKEGEYAAFDLEYNLAPYKYELKKRGLRNTLVYTDNLLERKILRMRGAGMPVCPKFTVHSITVNDSTMDVHVIMQYDNTLYTLHNGTSTYPQSFVFPQIIMTDNQYEFDVGLYMSAEGNPAIPSSVVVDFEIEYQGGWL